jgi:hypothetical protein
VTKAEFTTDFQNVFKNTTASNLGITEDQVAITDTEDTLLKRHLQAGLAVNYVVTFPDVLVAPDVTTLTQTLNVTTFGDTFKANLLAYAAANNITTMTVLVNSLVITVSGPLVVIITKAPTTGPTAAPSYTSAPSESSTTAGVPVTIIIIIVVVVVVVGGGILAGLTYFLMHSSKPAGARVVAN